MFKRKSLLSLIVGLSLLCSGSLAAEPVDDPDSTTYCWGKGEMFEKFDSDREIVSKRDLTAKHFRNDDGSYTAVIIG